MHYKYSTRQSLSLPTDCYEVVAYYSNGTLLSKQIEYNIIIGRRNLAGGWRTTNELGMSLPWFLAADDAWLPPYQLHHKLVLRQRTLGLAIAMLRSILPHLQTT